MYNCFAHNVYERSGRDANCEGNPHVRQRLTVAVEVSCGEHAATGNISGSLSDGVCVCPPVACQL